MVIHGVTKNIGDNISVWYIKDGRQKLCVGTLEGTIHDFIEIRNFDGKTIRVNNIYEVE